MARSNLYRSNYASLHAFVVRLARSTLSPRPISDSWLFLSRISTTGTRGDAMFLSVSQLHVELHSRAKKTDDELYSDSEATYSPITERIAVTMAAELTLFLTITGEPGAPRVSLNVAKNVTATELRKQASETTKIPLESIKIIYRGKMIRDDDTSDAVSVFKLEEGSVLHCMGKPVKDAPAVDSTATAPVVGVGSTVTLNPSGAAAAAASSNTAVISATPTEQSDPLKAALQNMRNSNTPAVYQTAVATLDKLLGNIIAFPLEEKYRRVKKLNASFQKRLGGVQGGDSAILASGFINQTDNGDQFYVMEASPEAWPRLTAAKATLEIAVRETTAAAATSGNSMPMDLPSMFAGGLPGMPAVMDDSYMQNMMENPMMRNMMSDPAALQNMMRVRTA
jgi:hypothetical protein